jgi:predicted enzyme related to lactoylglutathione lyase
MHGEETFMPSNPVTWFEILGKDGAALQKFYADLFGWNIDAANPMNYGMTQGQDGGIGGGIAASQDGNSMVTVYISVDDLQAALDKAKSLGGEIVMPPMDVPNGPKIAQFKDPQGNLIGLMKPMAM